MAEFELNPLVEGISGSIGHVVLKQKNGKTFAGKKPHITDQKTPEQLIIRDIFSKLSHFAQLINNSVLTPYMRPKPKKMTHYNKFIKNNSHMFKAKEFKYQNLTIFNGPLFNPGLYKADLIDAGDPQIESIDAMWDTFHGGDPKDTAIVILYDESRLTGVVSSCPRGNGHLLVYLGMLAPIDPSKVHVYLVFFQPAIKGISKSGMVSGTAYSEVTFVRKKGEDESSTSEDEQQEEKDESQAPTETNTSSKSRR